MVRKPKSLPFEMKHPTASNGGGESSSFRVLYYGDTSAGSIPFMWESQPGTPKHAHTESSLPPPLTPPPAYHHQINETNSLSMQQSTSLRTLFLSTSDSSLSYDSFAKESTSLRNLFRASGSRRDDVAAQEGGDGGGGGGSPTSTLCFGGGLMNVSNMKKVKNMLLMSIGISHGKKEKID